MRYLHSTADIESTIEAIYIDQQGSCFPAQVANLVQRLTEGYNADEQLAMGTVRDLVDDLGDDFIQVVYDYDDLVNGFRPEGHLADLEYNRKTQTLEVRYHPKPPPDPLARIRHEFEDHLESSDYIPERLRQAYESILGN